MACPPEARQNSIENRKRGVSVVKIVFLHFLYGEHVFCLCHNLRSFAFIRG
jgi:hypothetical protein